MYSERADVCTKQAERSTSFVANEVTAGEWSVDRRRRSCDLSIGLAESGLAWDGVGLWLACSDLPSRVNRMQLPRCLRRVRYGRLMYDDSLRGSLDRITPTQEAVCGRLVTFQPCDA